TACAEGCRAAPLDHQIACRRVDTEDCGRVRRSIYSRCCEGRCVPSPMAASLIAVRPSGLPGIRHFRVNAGILHPNGKIGRREAPLPARILSQTYDLPSRPDAAWVKPSCRLTSG